MTAHRFSYKSVSRYLPTLETLCALQTPQRLILNPTEFGLATETVVARLRDAANAIISGAVTQGLFSTELLRQKWPLYYVTSKDNLVLIVPKTEKGKQTESSPVSPQLEGEEKDILAVVDAKDIDIVTAFAILLGKGFLKGKVKVLGDEVKLPGTIDVEIVLVADNTFIMF